jgi:putative ABC transport system permease protein
MNLWLNDFAYRITIQWWVFAATGLISITIALIALSFQTIKAAVMKPVTALKTGRGRHAAKKTLLR